MKIRPIFIFIFSSLFLLLSNITVADTICSLIHSTHQHSEDSGPHHSTHHAGHDRHHHHDDMPDHEPHGYNQGDQIHQTVKKLNKEELQHIFINFVLPVSYAGKLSLAGNSAVFRVIDYPPNSILKSSLSSRAPPAAPIV